MKKAFAVDQANLLLVNDFENSVKGSKGPSEYLPAKGFHCEYLSIWKRVAEKYNIELDEADWAVIIEAQLWCGSSWLVFCGTGKRSNVFCIYIFTDSL